jgi:hypothetical protein
VQYITETFAGVDIVEAAGDYFFIYDPARNLPPNRRLPFSTLIVRNHDGVDVARLERPDVFRLNVGVGKDTFRGRFGAPSPSTIGGPPDPARDYAALDRLLPHPVYAPMHWVCVLNPSAATFEKLRPLLAEAYALVVRRRTPARAADTT